MDGVGRLAVDVSGNGAIAHTGRDTARAGGDQ